MTRKLIARKQVLVKWHKTVGLGCKGLTQAPQEGKLPHTGEVIRLGSLTWHPPEGSDVSDARIKCAAQHPLTSLLRQMTFVFE